MRHTKNPNVIRLISSVQVDICSKWNKRQWIITMTNIFSIYFLIYQLSQHSIVLFHSGYQMKVNWFLDYNNQIKNGIMYFSHIKKEEHFNVNAHENVYQYHYTNSKLLLFLAPLKSALNSGLFWYRVQIAICS